MSEELGLFESSSDSSQYVRYAPQSKKWKSNGNELDLKQIALDFKSLKTGWGIWPEGQAITWTFGEVPSALPKKPTEQHKQGFYIDVYIHETNEGSGVKELTKKTWSSLSFGERETIRLMHRQVKEDIKANAGKIAVFTFDGASENMKVGQGNTNYAKCTFKSWAEKPGETVANNTSDDDPVFG